MSDASLDRSPTSNSTTNPESHTIATKEQIPRPSVDSPSPQHSSASIHRSQQKKSDVQAVKERKEQEEDKITENKEKAEKTSQKGGTFHEIERKGAVQNGVIPEDIVELEITLLEMSLKELPKILQQAAASAN